MNTRGKVTAGCYAAPLQDCDGPLTEERFLSTAVLAELGAELPFEGLPFIPATGPAMVLPIKALKSAILCRRHNGCLSQYDAEAALLMRMLLRLHRGDAFGSVTFNGHSLERWMAKVLFGLGMSKNIGIKGVPMIGHPDFRVLAWLFGHSSQVPIAGLYVLDLSRTKAYAPRKDLEISPYGSGKNGGIGGIFIKMLRVGLVLSGGPKFTSPDPLIGSIHRPGRLIAEGRGTIELVWDPGTSKQEDWHISLVPPVI